MVSNKPEEEKLLARKYIYKILQQLLDGEIKEISLTSLELQTLMNFEVSDLYTRRFIKKYFVEPGVLELNDDMLRRAEQ